VVFKICQILFLTSYSETPWLIIYANLKSLDSIEEYWPDETSYGRAIITTTTDMTDSMTDQGKLRTIKRENVFNVARFPEPFDVQEVIEDRLRIPYHLPPGSDIVFSEEENVKIMSIFERSFSQNHYLLMTGALIGRKMYTVDAIWTSFASWHSNNDRPMPVWRLAFDTLSYHCNDILSVLSCLKDDVRIPRDIFKATSLPMDMKWCLNDDE